MPGTSINNIDYNNSEDAKIISNALDETENPSSQPPQNMQEPSQQEIQQRQQQMQEQMQYQMQMQQQQMQQQMQDQHMQQQQMMYGTEHMTNQSTGFTIPDSLKKSAIVFILLLLLNNNGFKQILSKIPLTTNEGGHTYMMTLIVAIIISITFFLISQVL